MTVRADNRLADAPMVPVRCARCLARVEVRKSSWPQTSIQWDATARGACEELPPAKGSRRLGSCSALLGSIADATADGSLHVPDDGY